MKIFKKMYLIDFLILFVSDLIGRYLSHQVPVGTMFSVAFASILVQNIVAFAFLHLLAPITLKFINNGFLVEEKIIQGWESEVPQKNTPARKNNLFLNLKPYVQSAILWLFALLSMYTIFRILEWLLPNLNAISIIGMIIVVVKVLVNYWVTETK
jgi:hypothetical protein